MESDVTVVMKKKKKKKETDAITPESAKGEKRHKSKSPVPDDQAKVSLVNRLVSIQYYLLRQPICSYSYELQQYSGTGQWPPIVLCEATVGCPSMEVHIDDVDTNAHATFMSGCCFPRFYS